MAPRENMGRADAYVEHEDVVEALAADRADDALHEGILPGGAWGGEDLADPHTLESL